MKEYEYSFEVEDLKPYLKYCDSEGFKKVSENKQTRDLYTNNSGINARVTINKISDLEEIILDFKEDDDSKKILKNTKESMPLVIEKKNIKVLNSILDILDYKLMKHLVRTRYVYEKGNVKFEIDKYTKPIKMNVVAIEGKKEEVDKIYNIVNEMIK